MSNCRIETFSAAQCSTQNWNIITDSDLFRSMPNIEKRTILAQRMPSFEVMFRDIQSALNIGSGGTKIVKTKEYFTKEICCNKIDNTFKILPVATAGNTVTATVKGAYNKSGNYSKPLKGHEVYFTDSTGIVKKAMITAVDTSVPKAHTITLQGVGGDILDFTTTSNLGAVDFKLVYNQSKPFNFGCLTGEKMVQDIPALHLQKMRTGTASICFEGAELSALGYDRVPTDGMGIFDIYDQTTNRIIRSEYNWQSPSIYRLEQIKNMDMLRTYIFGNANNENEFDGIYTVAQRGKFSGVGNYGNRRELEAKLNEIARDCHAKGHRGDVVLLMDFEFGVSVNSAIKEIVRNDAPYTFPIFGGSISSSLVWSDFKGIQNYNSTGINFVFKQIDFSGIEDFSTLAKNFAIVMPMIGFKDDNGNSVAPIEFTQPMDFDNLGTNRTWVFDERNQNCYKITVNSVWSYGMEIHCKEYMGLLSNNANKC
jgi:hypothetical protein